MYLVVIQDEPPGLIVEMEKTGSGKRKRIAEDQREIQVAGNASRWKEGSRLPRAHALDMGNPKQGEERGGQGADAKKRGGGRLLSSPIAFASLKMTTKEQEKLH